MMVLGWGSIFPGPSPVCTRKARPRLAPVSYWIVALTGLAGVVATILWWQYADQNK